MRRKAKTIFEVRRGDNCRILAGAPISIDVGNGLKEVMTMEQLESDMNEVKVDSCLPDGQSTICLVLDVENSETVEPLRLDWKAEICFVPMMPVENSRKAAPTLERIA